MRTPCLFAAALALLGPVLAAPAFGAATVIGGGLGRECYLAAEFKRERNMSLDVCNRALEEEQLQRRDRAATLVNRGIVHMHGKDLVRALADYEAAIRLEPRLAEAHVNRGIALLYMGGEDQAAIAALTHGLSLNPVRPEVAYYTRAVAYEVVGNVRAAYDDYQAAAAARPGWEEPIEQLKRFQVERRPVKQG
jgi:tetratricopeptide (TPR) repeat protein